MAEYEVQMKVEKWIATTVQARNLDKAIEIAETAFRDGNYEYVQDSDELTYEYWVRNEDTQEAGMVNFQTEPTSLKDE